MIAANRASSSSYDVRIRPVDRRVDGAHVTAHVDAVAVGQPGVEDRDVRPSARGCGGPPRPPIRIRRRSRCHRPGSAGRRCRGGRLHGRQEGRLGSHCCFYPLVSRSAQGLTALSRRDWGRPVNSGPAALPPPAATVEASGDSWEVHMDTNSTTDINVADRLAAAATTAAQARPRSTTPSRGRGASTTVSPTYTPLLTVSWPSSIRTGAS